MKMTLRAGAFVLAMIGLLPELSIAGASEFTTTDSDVARAAASINIGRIRSALRLTAEQQPYWPPVEAALRDLARRQAQAEPAGFVKRVSNRVVSIMLDSAAIERLAVAARPLIGVLDDDQRRAAAGLAHEMGLGPVVAALR